MATIKVSKKEIKKLIKSDEEIIEKINLLGMPIENVLEDEYEIQILPNRPDALSEQGFLRALKSFLGKETGVKKYIVNKPEKNYKVRIDSSVKNIRPFTACAIIKNLKLDDTKIKEIIELQEKLHLTIGRNRKKIAIGIYPLEKISLPITLEARKPQDIKFVPLDMKEELNGLQILQRHPTGREYAKLVEGFDRYAIFIDSKNKILSMPPIINSNETGKVTENTYEVFIECSGFEFGILNKVLNIIVTTLADMGGKIYSMELDYGKKIITPNLESEKIKLSLDNVNKLIGLDLKEKDLNNLLPKMGYDYSKGDVHVPAWRIDVIHEVDIIEDVAIAYGYNNLLPEIPKVATIGEESESSKIENKIAELLVGLDLIEISTYHLIKDNEAKIAKLKDEDKVELQDSKTEYKILRPNLKIPMFRIFSENKDNEYPQRLFEIGTVFTKETGGKSETGIKEKRNLIIALTPGNFTEIKQILEYLTRIIGIDYKLSEGYDNDLIDGRTGVLSIDGKNIGKIGEVHPETLKNWGIKFPVSLMEISLNEIFSSIK